MTRKRGNVSVRQRALRAALRVIELEKKYFDKAADRVGSVQAMADKAVQKRVDAAKWLPKEAKQVVSEWIHTMKKGRGDLRKSVDVTLDLSAEFVKRVGEMPAKHQPHKKVHAPRKKSTTQVATA